MTVIPFGNWTPDMPAHGNAGLLVCKNVIPKTAESYGPFNGLSAYSAALNGAARCQGAFTARDNSGNIHIFAGTATTLERLSSASTSWGDVTGASPYTTAEDDMWKFAQYGLRVIATNFTNNVQSYVIGTSTDFADLSAAAPKGKYLTIWKEHVVLGHLSSSPSAVQWCAEGDPTDWPTPGTADAASKNADQQQLVEGDGGWIQGILGGLGNADGVVIQERAIFRVTYVGAPLIFTFDVMEGARGTPAPGSIIQLGGLFAYLGEDGFYICDGATSKPIGANRIDKFFFDRADQVYLSRMSGTVDPINKAFIWVYPGPDNNNGTPNEALIYQWEIDRWSFVEFPSGVEFIFRAGTFGYNLDNADSLGYTVDTSPFSPDSRFWADGRSILSGFDRSHRLGFFSGDSLAATLETGDMDLGEGRRVFVSGVRLISDGGSPTASIGYRNTQSGDVSYTTATSEGADGYCPQRISTRFARLKVTMPAGSTYSHIKGYEPRFRPEGLR